MTRAHLAALTLLVILAAAIRLPGVARPLIGNFATRNVVGAMMARNWALGRATFWSPRIDCLIEGERALHLVEVPLAAYAAGEIWRTLGGSLDVWGRLVSILCSTASVLLLFFLVRRWHGERPAWAAAAVLALSPVSIIYGQSFMVEASVVCLMLAALWCWTMWIDERRRLALVGTGLALALMLLSKAYLLVMLLPLAAMLAGGRRSIASGPQGPRSNGDEPSMRYSPAFVCLSAAVLLLAAAPTAAWVTHVWRLSDPSAATSATIYYSLREGAEAHGFPHRLLATSAFYAGVLKDLSGITLTPIGFVLAAIGLLNRSSRRHWAWLLSAAALVMLLPRKFHEMNYYYLVILPPLAVLAGLGWESLARRFRSSRRRVRLVLAALVLAAGIGISLRLSIKPAFVTPAEDRAVVAAGASIQRLTTPDEPVAAMHGTSLDLLYYCDRPGWNRSSEKQDLTEWLRQCRERGARLLVVAGLSHLDAKTRDAVASLTVVREGDDYLVARLP